MTLPLLAPPPATYPAQAFPGTMHAVRCSDLPPAWADLLRHMYDADATLRVTHIATGGSDRSFYRVESTDERRSVVVCVTPSRSEFVNYVSIGRFLRERGLPVPLLHLWSDETGIAVLQDAGRQALQDIVLTHGAHSTEVYHAYTSVLRVLGQLQALEARHCCDEMVSRPFSETDLRWETSYFRENFLGLHLGWDCSRDMALDADFATLAQRVLREPQVAMHRDFQSQNVFLEGSQVWVLDFQGARLGPAQYDLASLLRDPYVSLPADVEERLLRFYHAEVGRPVGLAFDAFCDRYAAVSLQRLMQALGAYGYLSLVKNKTWFRNWIRPALGLLSRAVAAVDGLPRLQAVVAQAVEREADLQLPAG